MTGKQEAIDAVAEVFREKMPSVNCEAWAQAVLEAAEKAWPHQPPKRDPESTTAAQTERAWQPHHRDRARLFGFGPPTMGLEGPETAREPISATGAYPCEGGTAERLTGP